MLAKVDAPTVASTAETTRVPQPSTPPSSQFDADVWNALPASVRRDVEYEQRLAQRRRERERVERRKRPRQTTMTQQTSDDSHMRSEPMPRVDEQSNQDEFAPLYKLLPPSIVSQLDALLVRQLLADLRAGAAARRQRRRRNASPPTFADEYLLNMDTEVLHSLPGKCASVS